MITRDRIESYEFSSDTAANPGKEIESILTKALQPDPFPEIKSISLFYIAGVEAAPKEQVIYEPEFLYVVDLGTAYYAGIRLPYKVAGLGDPSFPDFSSFELRSVTGLTDRELVFPAIAGELLIGVVSGTPEKDVIDKVSAIARSVTRVSTDLYKATVKPFDEPVATKAIEAISFVRYAELNWVFRIIDFKPGWRATAVL